MSNNKRMNVPPWIKIVLVAIIVLLGLEYLSYPETETGVIRKSGSRLSVGVIGRAAAGDPVAATPIPSSSRAVVARTYTVRQGDWLSRVFPNTWEAICVLNDLADCGRIYPGQVLTLPEGVEAAEKSARAAKPKGRPVVKTETPKAVRAAPMVNDAGEILYRIVGTAPLKGCGKKDILTVSEEAWATLGLSEEDRVYLRLNIDQVDGPRIHFTAEEGLHQIETGVRLEQVTFCRAGKAVATGPMRTAWDATVAVYGERFVLPSGKVLVWMRNCFNWVILPEEKKASVPPPPQAEPPVAEIPPPQEPIVAAAEERIPTRQTETPKGFCDRFDPKLVIGQEHEPRHDGGDQADSNFLAAALYCTWRNEDDDGTHGLGAKLLASSWDGTVNQRAGKYNGTLHLVGPAYEYISDDGWDTEVSVPMVGQLHERFRQDKYRSKRNFDLIGASAGANFYQRRLAGEEWFPETQVFGTIAKPLSRSVSHSWDGQAIADTEELSRFGTYLNLGVRQWLYEDDDSWALPYAQLGYFLETPSSESMSARLGVSDRNRICGIGAGVDYDLKRGGDVFAWGWWCDIVKGIRVGRAVHRKHQFVAEAASRGITVEENRRGYIESIRFSEEWERMSSKK